MPVQVTINRGKHTLLSLSVNDKLNVQHVKVLTILFTTTRNNPLLRGSLRPINWFSCGGYLASSGRYYSGLDWD